MAISDPGDAGLQRAEDSARADALNFDRLQLDNVRVKTGLDVAAAVTTASVTRTVEGPSTLVVTLDDPGWGITDSGLLDLRNDGRLDAVDVKVDTLDFRLVKAEPVFGPDTDQVTLTFEEREVALLKVHNRPLSISRNAVTRAQFAHRLVREVRSPRIAFYSPEEDEHQGIAARPKNRKQQDAQRLPGFADKAHLTVKGTPADAGQLREMETVLTVADENDASSRARLAQACAAIEESGFRAVPNARGSGYEGVFQADPAKIARRDTRRQALHFLIGGLGFQGGGAIAAAHSHPDWSPGRIALEVEGSLANFGGDIAKGERFYNAHLAEARKIVAAWLGGTTGTSQSQRTVVKPYHFTRGLPGKRENSWQCLQRLAEEVGWRCFVVAGVVFFISEERLFTSRARGEISRTTPGVTGLSYDWDEGKTTASLHVQCRASRWAFPPGSVISVDHRGALGGRWLVEQIDRPDMFDEATEITLSKPIARRREPAADTIQVARDVTDDAKTNVDKAYTVAKHIESLKIPYLWGGGHDVDLDQLAPHAGLDCSGAVCLVLHRAGMFDDRAVVSGRLEHWGTPGKGRELTVYANANHTFLVFTLPGKKPQAWEAAHTGTLVGFSDRAQRPDYGAGFVARHYPGT